MKKLIMFLSGLCVLILTFGMLYVSGAIFDAGKNLTVQPYFFQPNYLSENRTGTPQTPQDMGDTKFMELLVKKYITEYFYAIPDVENIARRTTESSTLYQLSYPAAFKYWSDTEAQVIQKLAEEKALRTVKIIDEIYKPTGSDYWIINYELTTWEKPNDFNIQTIKTRGTLYLKIIYEPGMIDTVESEQIYDYLKSGGDPAPIFKFRVTEVVEG